jgi:hypothetical protein
MRSFDGLLSPVSMICDHFFDGEADVTILGFVLASSCNLAGVFIGTIFAAKWQGVELFAVELVKQRLHRAVLAIRTIGGQGVVSELFGVKRVGLVEPLNELSEKVFEQGCWL